MKNVYLILLAIFLLILLFVWSNPAKAHETEIWKDTDKYISYGQAPCGMGYVLSRQANGRWQPYLYTSGHWHITTWDMPTSSCDAFYDRMNEEAFGKDD